MREQRRTVERYEVRCVGGPLDGLWLAVDRMSDDTRKIVGGALYDEKTLAQYRLDGARYVWQGSRVDAQRFPFR